MNPISKLRFDSLAGYSRTPFIRLAVHELGWFEEADEKVLGMLALDLPDEDYDCFVLGRDRKGRFRAVWVDSSIPSVKEAYGRLETKLAEYARMPPEEFYQDDEVGRPLDFFTPIVTAESLNPKLRVLLSSRGASSARGLLAEMMHYFEDVDGNFVQQFQTSGFDARIWELYLYALFTEYGYAFDHGHSAPDFHCVGLPGEFFVEATTVNPSDKLPEAGEAPTREYFEQVIPMRFGSALFSKLKKTHKGMRYWELPHVAGHPFIIAIQDFHALGAMSWSSSALAEYLYGIRQTERTNADGAAEIISEQVDSYRWDGKEVPAGFFRQPETENISAVLANPEGTFSKFNRMGYLAGFGDRDIRMIRDGICYHGSLTPQAYVVEVNSPDYSETWCEGLSVYHNPRATIPLPVGALPGAAHHTSRDGRIMSRLPPFHPVGSTTRTIIPT
jgi:hypothetical protein